MKKSFLILFLFYLVSSLTAQISVNGTVKNYEKDYFLLNIQQPLELPTFNDTLFVKDGHFSFEALTDKPTVIIFSSYPITLFVKPKDSIHLLYCFSG